MTHSPVFIVASAYGAPGVDKHGQPLLASLAARCGASGFEIRRELFPNGRAPLDQLRAVIQDNELIAVFSAPWGIWTSDGKLNRKDLLVALAEAKQVNASYIKLPLGVYDPPRSDVGDLGNLLEETGNRIQLTVENDPTAAGGNLQTLRRFFENCLNKGIPLRMTFDIGNWSWTGEDVFEAAEALADHVVYLHCKEADDRSARTGPISDDPRRAWRQVLAFFPRQLPRGGEFLITGDDLEFTTQQYIRLLSCA